MDRWHGPQARPQFRARDQRLLSDDNRPAFERVEAPRAEGRQRMAIQARMVWSAVRAERCIGWFAISARNDGILVACLLEA